MIKKEKIFELKIQEDDDLSGIDSISLVDEPAIEVNWVAFKKEKEHEFHIPDGEDNIYLEKLMATAQDEQELFDEGWVVDRITILGKDGFISTSPNDPSIEDEKEYNVRYKYILNPSISQSPIIKTTRDFCKTLINRNLVWRIEDMEATTNDFGDSAMVWRGGYNCRHVWSRIEYKKDATIINKASINKGKVDVGGFPSGLVPDTRVLGMDQPSTVTGPTLINPSSSSIKNLGLSKEKLDITPNPCWEGYKPIGLKDDGSPNCVPISKEDMESVSDYPESVRNNAKAVLKYVEENGWGACGTEVGKIRANQLAKGEPITLDTVKRMYSYLSRHAGDLDSSKGYGDGCGKLMYDAWGGKSALSWAESKLNNFSFEKVSIDYDDTLSTDKGKELAKKLLKEGQDVSIITRRQSDQMETVYNTAKELGIPRDKVHSTNGKLKWETIKKLGIEKHIDNNEKELQAINDNVPDVKTEKFDYDVSGLPVYVDQLPKKKKKYSEEFEYLKTKEDMSKQHFATDNEKHIVLGPAMIPDQKIFRKDAQGNPYYVYFSPDTIRMIAEKYMRNKYTDNNDTMHDGKAIKDIHVLESWIKEDTQDKSNKYGFENLPIGTWFVSMKVNNPKVWEEVKKGKLNGFSVSGYFEEVASFSKEEMFLYKVAELLKNIKD